MLIMFYAGKDMSVRKTILSLHNIFCDTLLASSCEKVAEKVGLYYSLF